MELWRQTLNGANIGAQVHTSASDRDRSGDYLENYMKDRSHSRTPPLFEWSIGCYKLNHEPRNLPAESTKNDASGSTVFTPLGVS